MRDPPADRHPDADQPRDTMQGRAAGSRLRLWLVVDANRWAVAGAMAASIFVSLVVLGAVDPSPLRAVMSRTDPVETLFQAFVTAIITGVTLVLTINQLVLSQELGAVGDQRERMRGALSFRADAAALLDEPVSPVEPSAFLRALVAATGRRAEALADAVADADDSLRGPVSEFVDGLTENTRAVESALEGAEFGSFDVLSAALDFNYSWKIYRTRRLRAEHAGDIDDATADAFDDLLSALELFGPAREHFKTLYFQWELIDLSRAILYAAAPALVVTAGVLLYLDAATFPGTTLGVSNLVWVVSAASTVALVPFVVLLSYILRIATVAKRTLSIGPFILRERGDDRG